MIQRYYANKAPATFHRGSSSRITKCSFKKNTSNFITQTAMLWRNVVFARIVMERGTEIVATCSETVKLSLATRNG